MCANIVKTVQRIKQTSASVSFHTNLNELFVVTDQSRLQQVLINLLINATKFTKEGEIILELDMKDGFIQFSVTDTGIGIPLDKQKNIFSRFEKLNENAQGTGLGLYICKLIVLKLGGDIWVDSSYTSGARFVFTHSLKLEEKDEKN